MGDGAVRIGEWTLQLGSQHLSNGHEERRLNPKEFSVLLHLAEAAPDLVESDALLARTWPSAVVTDGALYQIISRLRRTLNHTDATVYIETQSKRGYRLVAPVAFLRPRAAPRRRRTDATRGMAPRVVAAPPSIAVLPLARATMTAAEATLSESLREDLINGLSMVDGFQVASRTSGSSHRDSAASAEEIARQLGVRYLLEGSLRCADDRVRVYLQLIDVYASGFSVWADHFTRTMEDLFALQDDIVRRVIDALSALLRPTLPGEFDLRPR